MITDDTGGVARTLWSADRLMSRQGMDGRTPAKSYEDAILISSLTANERHAPCLDIDDPATIEPDGKLRIELTQGYDRNEIVGLADALALCGLGGIELVEPLYDGDAEDAGWPPNDYVIVDLVMPFRLVPSTNNVHLYIDCDLEWERYAALINALADFGLLEEGFADNSLEREMTMLIRPGLTKEDLRARGIEVDNYDDDVADVGRDSTRDGSPDGAVESARATDSDSAEKEQNEEAMETTEQSNSTQTAPPPAPETALATTKPNGLKIKEGETLVRRYSGQYPVPLSLDDRKKYSDSLAELNVRVAALEEKKKQATAQYATELKKVKLDINRLANALHNNKELREIDVYDVLDRSGGVVETRRLLDGETVGVRAAEHDDRQANLPGTIPGLEEGGDDEDDDDALEQRTEDNAEPHELDEPHNGQTVQASGGAQVHHMPDDEEDEPDDDDGGDLDDDDDDEGYENPVTTPPTGETRDDGFDDNDEEEDDGGNPGPASADDVDDASDIDEADDDDEDHGDEAPAARPKKKAAKKPASKKAPKKGKKR